MNREAQSVHDFIKEVLHYVYLLHHETPIEANTCHSASETGGQHHPSKLEVTEALKGWNQDGPCCVVVLSLLLIHCCIDYVFI